MEMGVSKSGLFGPRDRPVLAQIEIPAFPTDQVKEVAWCDRLFSYWVGGFNSDGRMACLFRLRRYAASRRIWFVLEIGFYRTSGFVAHSRPIYLADLFPCCKFRYCEIDPAFGMARCGENASRRPPK